MSGNPTPEYITELQRTWEEFKKSLKDDSAEGKEKQEKLEKKLDKLEEVNQKTMADHEAAEKALEEQKERIDTLEKKLYRLPGGSRSSEKSAAVKALETYARKGSGGMSEQEIKELNLATKDYLRTDIDPQGGFLVPEEMSDEILKKITEISAMRQICRVKATSSKSYPQPVRQTLVSGSDTAEGEAMVESTSTYGEVEIFCKKMTAKIPLSTEIIEDAAFDMESEVMEDAREEFMRREGYWFVQGRNALKQANGLMNNADVGIVNSGVADDFTANSMIDLAGELKFGYDPMYGFKRQTLARIRKFEDGQGRYLWTPSGSTGLAPGAPNEINGERYVILQDMDSIAADAFPVVYGDFRRGYLIVDRRGITMLRDPYTQSDNDKIVYKVTKRTGGDVVLAEAFVKLKCAV